jgi:hypothetical protein
VAQVATHRSGARCWLETGITTSATNPAASSVRKLDRTTVMRAAPRNLRPTGTEAGSANAGRIFRLTAIPFMASLPSTPVRIIFKFEVRAHD